MFVDGIYLKRSWGGEMTIVSVLVAIGVNGDSLRNRYVDHLELFKKNIDFTLF